jgi:uncharacterized protein
MECQDATRLPPPGGRVGRFPGISAGLRLPVLLFAETIVIGLCMTFCPSPADTLYASAIPCFLVYLVLWRRDLVRNPPWRYVVYFALMSLAAAGGLIALSRTMPRVTIAWTELLAAVYFLAALHLLLWALDRGINAGLSKAFRLAPAARLPRRRAVPRTILRLAGLALVGGPLVASALATHGPKFTDLADPREVCGLSFERAAFLAPDGVRVAGWYIPAPKTSSDATVIIVPARGMSKACFLPHATMLAEDGFNVLLVDLRGEGESGGHARGFGVIEQRDVMGAVEYLRGTHPRQSRHVFALGVSEGAAAVLAAAREDARIEAVIVDSAFPQPAADLERMMPRLPWPLNHYFQKATLLMASAQLGCNLFDRGASRDIAALSPRPVLVIHGQQDEDVSISQAEGLYAEAHDPAMLWQVREAGHGESLSARPADYAHVVCKTLEYVRLGMPAFYWTHKGIRRQG